MLKTLLKKQMMEIGAFLYQSGKEGKRRSTGFIFLYVLLFLYTFSIMGYLFYRMANAICEPLLAGELGWLYFALMGTMATAMGVIGSVFTTYSKLYQARDNDLLLSMPISPSKILFVRMTGIYIMAFVFEMAAMFPAEILYFMKKKPMAVTIIFGILILFFLPLLALTISCILGWMIGQVAVRISGRVKNIVTMLLSLGFIGGYYYLYSQMYRNLQLILTNSDKIGYTMKAALYPMYQMGLAMEGEVSAFFIFLIIVLLLFGCIYFILSCSFIKFTTAGKAGTKAEYKEKTMTAGSLEHALFRKEGLRFLGNSVYMLNCGLGTVMLLVGAVAVVIKGNQVLTMLGKILQDAERVLPLLACGAVCLMAAMNDITAPSVSLEGKNLWIVQSLPIPAWSVLKAKLKLHLIMTVLPMFVCAAAVIAVVKPGVLNSMLILVFSCIYVLFCAAFGLAINLKMPNLDWTNETVAVKQSIGVMIALLGNWAVLFVLGGIYYLMRDFIDSEIYLLLGTVLLGSIFAFTLNWLKTKGTKIFSSL